MKLIYRKETKDLVKGCKAGNAECQRQLYERYVDKMYMVCMRYARDEMEAQDMLQDGFVRVFNKINTFKGEGSLEGWIRRVIVNVAIRHCQNRNRHNQLMSINDVEEKISVPTSEIDFDYEDLIKMVRSLPDGYQTVFNLYAIEGFSHKEIAAKLGISEGTSKSQVARARQQLTRMVNRYRYFHGKVKGEQSAG